MQVDIGIKTRIASKGVRLLICSLLYQAVWFSAVYSAARPSLVWLGPVAVVLSTSLQLLLWSKLRLRALLMMGASLLVGLCVDSLLTFYGVFIPQRTCLPYPLAPVWLLSLWAGFGVYIALGLEQLYGRLRLASVAGFFGGALAYRAGVPFGALEFGLTEWLALLLIAGAWMLAFPLLVWLASWFRGAEGRRLPTVSGRVATVAVIALVCLLPAGGTMALEGDTSLFSPTKRVEDVELVLRGVGRLRRYMINGCDIALFTPPDTTRKTLFEGTAKALEFVYYRKITGKQFAEAAELALRKNVSPADFVRFKADIDRMGGFFATVNPYDRYLLYYIPGDGTALDLNGNRQGIIPGDEFADIYFRIWLGDHPLDRKLYEGMMKNVPKGDRR